MFLWETCVVGRVAPGRRCHVDGAERCGGDSVFERHRASLRGDRALQLHLLQHALAFLEGQILSSDDTDDIKRCRYCRTQSDARSLNETHIDIPTGRWRRPTVRKRRNTRSSDARSCTIYGAGFRSAHNIRITTSCYQHVQGVRSIHISRWSGRSSISSTSGKCG